MKFYLVLVVVLVAIGLWRLNRHSAPQVKRQKDKAATRPQDMVSCPVCAVHLPSADAVQGKKGAYCSANHLHRAES